MKMNIKEIEKYIEDTLSYILGDISNIRKVNLPTSYPLILLTFSGIEFMSYLLFDSSSKTDRVSLYFKKWMSLVKSVYGTGSEDPQHSLGAYLYKFARNALAHAARVEDAVMVEHSEETRDNHMSFVEKDGDIYLFLHSYQFAEDFDQSVKKILENLRSNPTLCDNVSRRISKLESEWKTKSKHFFPNKKKIVLKQSSTPLTVADPWNLRRTNLPHSISGTYTPKRDFEN